MKELLGYLDGYKTYIGFALSGAIVVCASAGWIDWHTAGVLGGFAGAWTGVSMRAAIAKAHDAADYAAAQLEDQSELLRMAAAKSATVVYANQTSGETNGSTQDGVQQHPLSEKLTGPQS